MTTADHNTPTLSIPDARDKLYTPDSVCGATRALAYAAGSEHAVHAAGDCAQGLRDLFGDTAYRAVFDTSDDGGDGTDAVLLVVLDRDDNVIWYNRRTSMNGCEMVAARDAQSEPMPDFDTDTLIYLQNLVGYAEDAVSGGYLNYYELLYEPSIGQNYYGGIVELIIPDELASLAERGGAFPQRRLMTADERDLLAKALAFLVDNRGTMKPISLDDEEHAVLADLITVVTPRPGDGS